MKTIEEAQILTSTAKGILRSLIYFDVFNYPLTSTELLKYHPYKINDEIQFWMAIDQMVNQGLIFRVMDFYSIHNSPAQAVERINRNQIANGYLLKARKMTKIISQFPFVKMVAISGSLSKNTADENSDIDYFIISEKGRVWITRFLLTLYKKTILLNNSKYFCTNLIMAEDRLKFHDQSHYIATEIVSLLPLCGRKYYLKFMDENRWTEAFFPNSKRRDVEIVQETAENSWFSSIISKLLNNQIGDRLDKTWQEIIRRKWTNDHKNRSYVMENPIDFIDIQPHIAKGHGGDQYPRIRRSFQQKLEEFEAKFGVKL